MPQEIYNEGRVVGMSAYELYVRHQLSEYPELEPLTERQWLASTVGNGCSMILRIPKGTQGIFEAQLPPNSELCAASSITACVFDGQVALDAATNKWATRVISYGPLISNTANKHPVSPGDNNTSVPTGTQWSADSHAYLREYMKIVDGLVYQPGHWDKNNDGDKTPYMDLKSPDLNKRAVVRLNISKSLERDVYITISGWVHRPVIAGSTKLDAGALTHIEPYNGDFLGAERFPWAVKIILTVPTGLMHVLNDKAYIRKLGNDNYSKSVTSKAIIDMDSVNVDEFYASNDNTSYPGTINDSTIFLQVEELNVTGDGVSVLGMYQRDTNYPPVLYGTKQTHPGSRFMIPVDTAAPGTVKLFDNKTKAINYPKLIPNTYAFWHDKTNKNMYFVEGNDVVPLNTRLETKNLGSAANPKFSSIATSGTSKITSLSLTDDKGNMLSTSGSSGNVDVFESKQSDADRFLTWTDLLTGLGDNKAIDLIGSQLRSFRKNLPNITSGNGGTLNILGTGESKISGSLNVTSSISTSSNLTAGGNLRASGHSYLSSGVSINKGTNTHHIQTTDDGPITFNRPVRSGSNYIEFDQGSGKTPIRLYVSSTQPDPASVPVGSIGIGW